MATLIQAHIAKAQALLINQTDSLRTRAMVEIGKRSYGLYLWSWPISRVVGAYEGSLVRFVLAMALSVAASEAELVLYSVNAVTSGTESQGEVTVRLARAGRIVNGVGADTDIVVASAKAYLSALNKLQSKTEKLNPQI